MRYYGKMEKNFEKAAWQKKSYVCGIDEVGRGCLSGPLIAASAILPQKANKKFLKDSKLITKIQREKAYNWIVNNCFYSCVIIDNKTIDKKNIYQATRYAMKKSFIQIVELVPFDIKSIKYLITDAVSIELPDYYLSCGLELYNPTHAESISKSVAAASIIAKVTRDRLMSKFSILFPGFSLENHKGYGTRTHISAINNNGTSIIHRKSFVSNLIKKSSDKHEQQTFI